jgi:hypothetical protein
MEGIDISNTQGDFGPLSLKFNKKIIIVDETSKTYYKNMLMYVWTSLLSDKYKRSFKSWKSGFELYLEQYQIQFFKKSNTSNKKIKLYHLPEKDTTADTEKRSVEAALRRLPLMLEILEPSFPTLELVKNLLEDWDDIEVEESDDEESTKDKKVKDEDEFVAMKRSLKAVLNDSQNLSKLDKFITFFRQLPISYRTENIQIIKDELHNVTDSQFNMENEQFRNQLIQSFDKVIVRTNDEMNDIKKQISDLKKKHKKFKEVKWLTRDEVYNQKWKVLSRDEKSKYYRNLEPIFRTYYHQSILDIFKTHLTTVYQDLLKFYENKEILLSTVRNVDRYVNINYGPDSIPSIKNLVYIDPFSFTNPYYGVGITKTADGTDELRGPNIVGEVLVELGKQVAREWKENYIEKQKHEKYKSRLEFYTVYTRLSEILRERDITEFSGLSVTDILSRFQHAYNIQLKNKSVTVYVNCNKYDCKNMTETILSASLKEIGYEPYLTNGKLRWFKQTKNMLEQYSERVIDFVFENNTDNIYELYKHEHTNPGSIVNHLRKIYLPTLYLDQVVQEKNSVMRAVFKFIYLVDPQKRIDQDTVQDIIDFEFSQLTSLEYSTLLEEIDNAYLDENDESLDAFIPANFPKTIEIDGDEKTIEAYIDLCLEQDKEDGFLVRRISRDKVDKAKQWKFLFNNFNNDSEEDPQVVSFEPDISPRDTNVFNMFQEDVANESTSYSFKMNTEYGKKVDRPYSNLESESERRETRIINAKQNKIHNIDNNTIIFSSVPNQYAYFPLTPTYVKLCTIDYFKFPTVVHAVMYLWYTRNLGYSKLNVYKHFLKSDWLKLFESLQLFSTHNKLKLELVISLLQEQGFDQLSDELSVIEFDTPEVSANELKHHIFTILINKTNERPFIDLLELNEMFNTDLERNLINNVTVHLRKVYEVRFNSSKLYKELLLKTGSSPLLYKAHADNILGTGISGNGYNLAGKVLMEFRDKFRLESNKVYEFTDIQLNIISDEIATKLYMYGRDLLTIIRKFITDDALVVKLMRGFLILYQINCGDGEQANYQIINKLTPIVNDITKDTGIMMGDLKGLLWDYTKILYTHYDHLITNSKNINKTCLFKDTKKNVSMELKEKATNILTKFLVCLFEVFNANAQQKENINSLVEDIINNNNGRTEYIANLSLRKLNDSEKEDIISGRINYFDMKVKTVNKILEDLPKNS